MHDLNSMIKIRFTLFLWFCLATVTAFAQQKTVVVIGRVTDAETGQPLFQASVTVDGTQTGASTGKTGIYKLKVRKLTRFTLFFQHLGYESYSHQVTPEMLSGELSDTLRLNVSLYIVPIVIKEAVVSAERPPPDTVFGTNQFNIEDFELLPDGRFIFLAYEKRLKKGSEVVLADRNQEVLHRVIIPDEAEELFRDFLGYVNVIAKYNVYRVIPEDDELQVLQLPKKDFDAMIRPAEDTLNQQILFSDYRWYYPEFSYFAFHQTDSTIAPFKQVVDKELEEIYRSEYKFMQPRQKLQARKIAIANNMDKVDVAALMTGFPNSLYYTPLFAPLFVVNDTIMVFDHYKNQLFKFDRDAQVVDSIRITYHREVRPKDWEREMHRDEVTGNIYAVFNQKGYYLLKELDTKTGKVKSSFRLYWRYVEKIQIQDGYVYYTYRPFESLQNKFLYRELIQEE